MTDPLRAAIYSRPPTTTTGAKMDTIAVTQCCGQCNGMCANVCGNPWIICDCDDD